MDKEENSSKLCELEKAKDEAVKKLRKVEAALLNGITDRTNATIKDIKENVDQVGKPLEARNGKIEEHMRELQDDISYLKDISTDEERLCNSKAVAKAKENLALMHCNGDAQMSDPDSLVITALPPKKPRGIEHLLPSIKFRHSKDPHSSFQDQSDVHLQFSFLCLMLEICGVCFQYFRNFMRARLNGYKFFLFTMRLLVCIVLVFGCLSLIIHGTGKSRNIIPPTCKDVSFLEFLKQGSICYK